MTLSFEGRFREKRFLQFCQNIYLYVVFFSRKKLFSVFVGVRIRFLSSSWFFGHTRDEQKTAEIRSLSKIPLCHARLIHFFDVFQNCSFLRLLANEIICKSPSCPKKRPSPFLTPFHFVARTYVLLRVLEEVCDRIYLKQPGNKTCYKSSPQSCGVACVHMSKATQLEDSTYLCVLLSMLCWSISSSLNYDICNSCKCVTRKALPRHGACHAAPAFRPNLQRGPFLHSLL